MLSCYCFTVGVTDLLKLSATLGSSDIMQATQGIFYKTVTNTAHAETGKPGFTFKLENQSGHSNGILIHIFCMTHDYIGSLVHVRVTFHLQPGLISMVLDALGSGQCT